jgi:ATP-dependent helicase IRC3
VDVVVASVPWLGRENNPYLLRYHPNEFKAVLIDEAHHATAATYRKILKHFHIPYGVPKSKAAKLVQFDGESIPLYWPYRAEERPLLWGCSATVFRADRASLGNVFDGIVFKRETAEMFQNNW